MKSLLSLTLSFVVLTAGALCLRARESRAQEAEPAPSRVATAPDMATLRTDMEVMRRVVMKRVLKKDQPKSSSFARLNTVFGNLKRGQGAEMVYVHGDGVQLRVDVPFAVHGASTEEPESGETKKPTLWEDVLADVEGRPRKDSAVPQLFEPELVRKFEDELLTTLALYGGRIRGLSDTDHFTVIVNGRADGRVISQRKTSQGAYELVLSNGQKITTTADPATGLTYNYLGNGTVDTFLTIRVPFSALRRLADDGSAAAEQVRRPPGAAVARIRQAAVIHRY